MKVLIVDDEPLAVQRLEKLVEEIAGFVCVATANNGKQALEKIRLHQPDIVLSDIRMPDMDGMALAQAIKEDTSLRCQCIFITAYEGHALAAFDLQVASYLLKPVSKEKLAHALQRARSWLQSQPVESQRRHLTTSSRGKLVLIDLDDVRLLLAEHKYVTVYHTQGESLIDDSLKSLEEEFPTLFKRVHRNALVAVNHIASLDKETDGQHYVKFKDIDVKAQVSRRALADVRQWLKQL